MEDLLKNKQLNQILEPFIKNQHNFDLKSKSFKKLEKQIREFFKSLNDDKENNDIIINSLMKHEFFNTFREMKVMKKPSPIICRQFVIHLTDLFKKFDECSIKNIINTIDRCYKQIDDLENTLNVNYIKTWYSSFCKSITESIVQISKRTLEITSKTNKNFMTVHIIQLSTLLQLLLKLFEYEMNNDLLIVESRRFVIKRFKFYFEELKELLNSETDDEQEEKLNFIYWMDQSLELIGIIEADKNLGMNVNNAKSALDEVLAHAMSTAQICSVDDSKGIKGSIQSVLHEYNQLETESKKLKYNPSLISLYVNSVSDKLCILESRINTAVLRISLNAFSDYFGPLRMLQIICDNDDDSILGRSESDLDILTADFDLHVDRIMQIGLFAVACTTDKKILSKIKASLMSLEALESELIPALTTLYMEPSQIACLHANLFVEHWKNEVNKLKEAVFYIIDPIAFGQVVREEYIIKLDHIKTILSKEDEVLKNEHVININKGVDVLIMIIKASLPDLKLENDTIVLKQLRDLEDVNNEVNAASALLSKESNRKVSERVFKRCQILLTVMERILKLLATDGNKNLSNKIKDDSVVKPEINVTIIVDRGNQLLKDRSVLYRTPKKNETKGLTPFTPKNTVPFTPKNTVPFTPKNTVPFTTPRTGKYSESRKLGITFAKKVIQLNYDDTNVNVNNSMDLQITDILEELTNLVDTLT